MSIQTTLLKQNADQENESIVITFDSGVHGLANTRIELTREMALKLRMGLRDALNGDKSFFHCDNLIHVTPLKPRKAVTFNADQSLFVIPCEGGYSCLGLDVCRKRAAKLAAELAITNEYPAKPLAQYGFYQSLVAVAKERFQATGWKSQSELTPELIGLEGKHVEVTHDWSSGVRETVDFYVGKSSGFIPCHLFLKSRNSDGGAAVCFGKIISVRVL